MLLQPTFSNSRLYSNPRHSHSNVSLSSTLSYSLSLPSRFPTSTLLRSITRGEVEHSIVTCSISQVYSYGTLDYERKPSLKWNVIYKRILTMDNPELGPGTVLIQSEKEGKKFTKWELCRIIKELRKYRRYKLALQVNEWMDNRRERYRITGSDAAIQLDLIAKVHGIPSAEEFFLSLPDTLKDKRTYGALLNSYVQTEARGKAESLIEKMRGKGYAVHALPFNVMMTLYMNLKEYDKVDLIVSEMFEKNIPLDIYSYNIWLSSRGSEGSVERVEEVFERMKLDKTINPNWTTFSTIATTYIRMGQLEKAESSLKNLESRITGRDRVPYHYLMSLYGGVGNREEVHRVWNIYKSVFPAIPNLGYHTVVASLIRMDDIEGAEKIYEEWLLVKTSYDPRIGNLLIGWYVRKDLFLKAEAFFNKLVETGGKPNSGTWELLADGNIRLKKITEALSCYKKAASVEGWKNWKPKPSNVSSFLKLCELEGDTTSKDGLIEVLRKMGCLENQEYMSYIPLSNMEATGVEPKTENSRTSEEEEEDGAEIYLNQL